MPQVEIFDLVKTYGPIKALDHITLTIKDREYVSILGPSGCGKTTLIKCIAGIIEPTSGEIYIDGKAMRKLKPEERNVGYVFQEIALFPHMDVWDNITYGPKVKGWSKDQTKSLAIEILDMMELEDRAGSYPNELSGGASQKTAVARAICSGSTLLLLDEPLGSLDAKVRSYLRYKLKELVKDLNLTAIHVTHDQEEAMSISDRIVVMRAGRVMEEGTPTQLYFKPNRLFTANFVGEANFFVGKIAGIDADGSVVDIGGHKIKVGDTSRELGEKVVLCIRPEFISIRRGSGKSALQGIIREIVFQGEVVRYEISISNELLILADYPTGLEPLDFKRGDVVEVGFAPEGLLIFQYPPEGLNYELSLE